MASCRADVLGRRDRDVGDRAAAGGAELGGDVVKGQQAGSGELEDVAAVTGLGERRHGDVCDVVGVNDRFGTAHLRARRLPRRALDRAGNAR